MRHQCFALFAVAIMAEAAIAQNAADVQKLAEEPLTVQTSDGEVSLTVEFADEAEEIRIGLMNRENLPEGHGMLFDFGQPREANMWMKNTLIPLDILFMDTGGQVLAVARDAEPMSTRIINPGFPVKGVLELNAGASARLGIAPGDIVVHRIFANVPDADAPEGEDAAPETD
jgi:uncharacterized protein